MFPIKSSQRIPKFSNPRSTIELSDMCTEGWFGARCEYKCHCLNGAACNASGDCEDGCADGWFGPSCQYRKDKSSYRAISKALEVTGCGTFFIFSKFDVLQTVGRPIHDDFH
ncbi:dendrite extension defective protein 1 [Plakobranchus ocellatus]|uniref:Dendrite extension defective protein 1 n=1 Tax=Plakobranchus ocellatus TaxID=259542 RepID=A0AAV3YCX0_9GAST|nr:dendrite extension defective protein 1 [Plakobranchus ocellatus]